MTPDEIAAEISGERDIHIECVLETLEALQAWGIDPSRMTRLATGGFIPSPPGASSDHVPAFLLSSPHAPLGTALVRDLATGKLLRYEGGQWTEVPHEDWPESMR